MSGPPVAALIFDIDGTIIDSMPYHAKSWPTLFERHGIEDRMDVIRSSAGRTTSLISAHRTLWDHVGLMTQLKGPPDQP